MSQTRRSWLMSLLCAPLARLWKKKPQPCGKVFIGGKKLAKVTKWEITKYWDEDKEYDGYASRRMPRRDATFTVTCRYSTDKDFDV